MWVWVCVWGRGVTVICDKKKVGDEEKKKEVGGWEGGVGWWGRVGEGRPSIVTLCSSL